MKEYQSYSYLKSSKDLGMSTNSVSKEFDEWNDNTTSSRGSQRLGEFIVPLGEEKSPPLSRDFNAKCRCFQREHSGLLGQRGKVHFKVGEA